MTYAKFFYLHFYWLLVLTHSENILCFMLSCPMQNVLIYNCNYIFQITITAAQVAIMKAAIMYTKAYFFICPPAS